MGNQHSRSAKAFILEFLIDPDTRLIYRDPVLLENGKIHEYNIFYDKYIHENK